MLNKLRVLPINQACPCPFYVTDVKSRKGCFIKQMVPVGVAMAMVDNPDFDPSNWDSDCGGNYEACSILPLLWNMEELPESPKISSDLFKVEEYNPFEDSSEEMESEAVGSEESEEDEDDIKGEPADVSPEEFSVKVSIHQVKNPYAVKCDVLVYPTNNLLTVDDPLLNRMANGDLQEECDRIPRPIKMGHIYATSNGNGNTRVRAQRILHAVIAGASRLVNEQDIKSAMRKSLLWADAQGAESVAIIPCDCGTHDIALTAMSQLSSIYTVLRTTQINSLKNIFLVMEDEESLEAFEFYFDRIFGSD